MSCNRLRRVACSTAAYRSLILLGFIACATIADFAAAASSLTLSGGYTASVKTINKAGGLVLGATIATGLDPINGGGLTLPGDEYGGEATIAGLDMHSSGFALAGSEASEPLFLGLGEFMSWEDTIQFQFNASSNTIAQSARAWMQFQIGWDLQPGAGTAAFAVEMATLERSKFSSYETQFGFTLDDFHFGDINGQVPDVDSQLVSFSTAFDNVVPLGGTLYQGTVSITVTASAGARSPMGNVAAAIDLAQRPGIKAIVDEPANQDPDDDDFVELFVNHVESASGYDYVNAALPNVPGDYNRDGIVDAADYTEWRDHLGDTTSLPNDDTPGVDQDDYTRWQTHFGETIFGDEGNGSGSLTSVPEPATLTLLATLGTILLATRRRAP